MSPSQRGSLEGIFSPVRVELAPATPDVRVEAEPDPVVESEPATARVQVTAPPVQVAGIRNVAVYLPVGLRDQLRDHARAHGLTITQVVEDAFAEHGSNYGELVGVRRDVPGSMPTRVSVRRSGATIQVQLRLDERQHEWLDSQVEQFEAPNRSALVSAVLRRHLGS